MPVPIVFRQGADTLINFDFLDIATGAAHATLYPSRAKANTQNCLFGIPMDSDDVSTQVSGMSSGAKQKMADLDFDIIVEAPIFLKGEALFNFTHAAYDAGSGSCEGELVIRIRKWDGTTETEIANATSNAVSNGAGGTTEAREAVKLTISTKTVIKQQEYLRITLEMWATSGSPSSTYTIYHDPTGRATTPTSALSEIFKCIIPMLSASGT